jgi:TolA-binding protein
MAPRVSTPSLIFGGLLMAIGGVGCATTASSSADAPTTAALPEPPDPEVVVLRERVTRLEKRLVEVDGKLSLLLARAEPATPATSPRMASYPYSPPIQTPPRAPLRTGERPVVDFAPPPRGDDDLAEGLRATDIHRNNGAAESDDIPIDDDGAVVLRMHGDGPAQISSTPSSGPDDIHADSDDVSDPLSALRSAKDLYAWGHARLKEARAVEAVAAFEEVLLRFPGHDLADNSMYWIGICHQTRGEHRLAIAEWQKLPARFPRSAKVPDALFGMAQSHEALGEPAVAEVLYDEIVASYPKAEKLKETKRALARLRPQQ